MAILCVWETTVQTELYLLIFNVFNLSVIAQLFFFLHLLSNQEMDSFFGSVNSTSPKRPWHSRILQWFSKQNSCFSHTFNKFDKCIHLCNSQHKIWIIFIDTKVPRTFLSLVNPNLSCPQATTDLHSRLDFSFLEVHTCN